MKRSLAKQMLSFILSEAFVTSAEHYRGKYVEFFVNPDRKELQAIGRPEIRFIIDTDQKKFYVFDGLGMNHDQAAIYLRIKNLDDPKYIRGIAKYDHGALITLDVDTSDHFLPTLLSHDFSWMKYYYSDFEVWRQQEFLPHIERIKRVNDFTRRRNG